MRKIKVFAPATVANVACGYDIMGFAVDKPGDEVLAELTNETGVVISKITGDGRKLPLEPEKNTAGVAVQSFLNRIRADKGVRLEINKMMPLGSGLGSSAASAVAAVYAVNELFGKPLSKDELLPFTVEAESVACGSGHADNVAPALYGGFVIIKDYHPLKVISIPAPELYCAVLHPDVIIRTEDARSILRMDVQLKDVVTQCSNVAGLVSGLFLKDYELIRDSLHDVIVVPHRSKLIPGFFKAVEAAREAGALGASISGSGPSIFALCKTSQIAKDSGEAMKGIYQSMDIDCQLYISPINPDGPKIIE
ncbi:homoserine kinase [Candidatus Woesearchaeota archaeon]|nr:homoserine kinase [Candidatus Woesearchaeota archaeon]